MPPRKRTAGVTPKVAPEASEAPTPDPTPDPPLVPAPEPAAEQAAAATPHPVRRYQIASPPPQRAGGYVLTQHGWVLDTGQEQ